MKDRIIQEPVRVLFHLNGYTKVLLERTDGLGLADGGITWDIETETTPAHLRTIGSRFTLRCAELSPEEMNDPEAVREARKRIEFVERIN